MKIIGVIILLLVAISSFSQDGSVKVHIASIDQENLGGYEMQLLAGDRWVACVINDQSGNFEISGIETGIYRFRMIHNDTKIYTESFLVRACEVTELDFNLHVFTRIHESRIACCPKGHEDDLIPIAYGLPSSNLIEEAEKGNVWLGGCIVTKSKWYCKVHEIEFL